ncbi:MAG: hypothetical protein LBM08_15360 [Dysgonamonadaceae bacterium]|nr:hypothetical protein [Dysgonamonadaceae bacterium]
MYIFKVVILFLIAFNFPIPLLRNSVILSALLCTAYYLLMRKGRVPCDQFFSRYILIILTALVALTVYGYLYPVLRYTYDMGVFRTFGVQLYMLLVLLYAFPVLFEDVNDRHFEYAMVLVIHIFAVQGLISLSGFLFRPVGDFLSSLRPKAMVGALEEAPFRFYCLSGNSFFDLPAGFGLSIILYFRVLFLQGQDYFRGIWKLIVFFLLFVGCVFIGRTSFVGVALALLLVLLMSTDAVVKFKRTIRGLAAVSLFVYIFLFTIGSGQRKYLEENVLPFAFEFLYNYDKTKRFSTASSDALETMYYPLSEKTLMQGDAKYQSKLAFYGDTDAGYMRNLLFGGIPYLLMLVVYQSLFFFTPLRLGYRRLVHEDRNDFLCLLILFVYIFILNYKGDALGRMQMYEVLSLLLGYSFVKNTEVFKQL